MGTLLNARCEATLSLPCLPSGSCGQLSLAANITKLPKETLDW